jgi:hypothetical protein
MTASRARGTRAETAFVDYLRRFYPWAERRALNGARDRGDVAGIPGITIEVKAAKRMDLGAWLRELDVEVINDRSEVGFLAVKPIGKTRGEDYFIVMRPE